MKRTYTALALISLIAAPTCALAGQTTVVVNAAVTLSSSYIMLGDIATITPSPLTDKTSARVASTIVGRAPVPGLSRPLNRGDICLKLRANGIDPAAVNFQGATNITITESNGTAAPAGTTTPSGAAPQPATGAVQPASAQSAPAQKVIKYGDPVDVIVVDGPVVIHAKAYATQAGAVGDSISVRRDGVDHLLTATVIAAGQVQLEE